MGRSYTDVSNQLIAGGDFEGYRYATGAEIEDLMQTLGFPVAHIQNLYGKEAEFQNAISLLGETYSSWHASYQGFKGFSSDVNSQGQAYYGVYTNSTPFYLQAETNGILGASATGEFAFIGSYLVAPSPVPVPAAVWLFGSGLIGLAGMARRKKA